MRSVLVSVVDCSQQELFELVRPHYNAWADMLGYETHFLTAEAPLGRSAHWSKIEVLRDVLPSCDYCLWIDADFVLLSDRDPVEEFRAEDFQALVMEQTRHGPGPNTGLWFLRNNSEARQFLELVWQTGQLADASLHDQATVAHLLGFSYLPYQTKPINPSPWLARTGWLDLRWNMLAAFRPEAPLVARAIHYGGYGLDSKLAAIRQQLISSRKPNWTELVGPVAAKMQLNPQDRYLHPGSRYAE